MKEEKKQRIVRGAVTLMGQRELAGRLGVGVEEVTSWLDGTAQVPDAILVELADILLSWSGKQRFT